MKTYSESNSKESFDWYEALNIDCIDMKLDQLIQLDNLASDWVTCAVGNQCNIIPRHISGIPIDDVLYYLGGLFSDKIDDMQDCVRNGNIIMGNDFRIQAINILKDIENRSIELLQEINASK